jgi:hypothetical protein
VGFLYVQKSNKIKLMENKKLPSGRPTKSAKVDTLKRETQVLELRSKGWTWQRIADATGYANASAAYNAFDKAIKRTMQPASDEVRTLELERLDRFLSYLWSAIESGDPAAIDRGLKIMDRRAKYLGLDAPVKQQVEITTYEGGSDIDREIERLVSLLEANNSAASNLDEATSETQPG